MEHLAKSVARLLTDTKWADLNMRCEGRVYRVYRSVLGPRSPVLEKMCDGSFKEGEDGIIEVTGFDPLTLERMLQYIYLGDYTVTIKPAGMSELSSSLSNGNRDESQTAVLQPSRMFQLAASNVATAHVFVYAIAGYYQLPDLKKVALAKYTEAATKIRVEQFAELAEAVYMNTVDSDDALRRALLAIALKRIEKLTACQDFMRALAEKSDLQQFGAQLLSEAVSKARSHSDEVKPLQEALRLSRAESEMMRNAVITIDHKEKKAHKENARLMDALSKANERANVAEEQVFTLRNEFEEEVRKVAQSEQQLKKLVSELQGSNRLTTQLQCSSGAYEGLYRDTSQKLNAVHKENDYLLRKLTMANADLDRANMEKKAAESKKEDAENRSRAAEANGKAAQRSLVGRRMALNEIVKVVDREKNCRNCGLDISFWLDWDDRPNATGLMLRCGGCGCRHFGKHVRP